MLDLLRVATTGGSSHITCPEPPCHALTADPAAAIGY
jgi:hypothetical protein